MVSAHTPSATRSSGEATADRRDGLGQRRSGIAIHRPPTRPHGDVGTSLVADITAFPVAVATAW